MALALLCDEHIPYPVVQGLERRGVDVTTVKQLGLMGELDREILEIARQQGRVIYTNDADFLRHHAVGVTHSGIIYHHILDYSIGEAIRRVAIACDVMSTEEIIGRIEFL
jgi:predicted nuclease of predicted toxin-antitoxin system